MKTNSSGFERFKGKKILFIVNSVIVGGHETQARNIVNYLKSIGADVTVLCPSATVHQYFLDGNIDSLCVFFNMVGKLWIQLFGKWRMAKIFRQYMPGFDCAVISGGSMEAIVGPLFAIKYIEKKFHVSCYVPMYIDRKQTHGRFGELYNILIDRVVRKCDQFITINKIQAKLIKKHTAVPTIFVRNKIGYVRAPLETRGKRLIFVGRLDDKQKNITGLISFLDYKNPKFDQLHIIGDGPDLVLVNSMAANTKYITVKIHGWLKSDQIDNFVGTEDILIINSRWEGEPLVAREFLARNLKVVSNDIAGVRGVVHPRFRFKSKDQLIQILENI